MNQDNPLSDQPTSLPSNPSNTESLAPGNEGERVVEAGADESSEDVNAKGESNAESDKEHDEDLRKVVEKELNYGLGLASSEKNAEFHGEFPLLPEDERLISDFQLIRTCATCSPSKPKARLYVTENYACRTPGCSHERNRADRFLNMTIMYKLLGNPLLFYRRTSIRYLYFFGSNNAPVLDLAYDAICKTWRVVQMTKSAGALIKRGNSLLKQTICACKKDVEHYEKPILDAIFLGVPERILDLLFTSEFIKEAMTDTIKYKDLHMSEWTPFSSNHQQALLMRRMTFTQDNAKYKVQDRIVHFDPDNYICVLSTKEAEWEGHSCCFSSRTCITWDSVVSSRVVVTTKFEWTTKRPLTKESQESRSRYIKKQCDDYEALLVAMSNHIEANQSEFMSQNDLGHIATMINTHKTLSLETSSTAFLNLDAEKIPSVLDLLQNEIKTVESDYQHSQKCIKLLQLLVNKHHILPPSLFLMGLTLEAPHILAVGGFSDVYKGTFEGKPVCVKVMRTYVEDGEEKRNKDLHEFYKETLLWNRLNHSNLLPFLGVTTTLFSKKVALVSPWMINGSITSFLKLKPRHDRLKVVSEIIAGIMYLHSHNIVHGDIKGANVLVDKHGQCYLGDFGLAVTSFTTTLLNSTTSGVVKGTTRWMAPEMFITGEDSEFVGTTGPECASSTKCNTTKFARDIYAFACTVYEIIAGEPPFVPLTDVQVMFKVLSGERPQRPSSVDWCPNSIWSLVEQCWMQKIRLRPTAPDIHKYLDHLEYLRWVGLAWGKETFPPIQEDEIPGKDQAQSVQPIPTPSSPLPSLSAESISPEFSLLKPKSESSEIVPLHLSLPKKAESKNSEVASVSSEPSLPSESAPVAQTAHTTPSPSVKTNKTSRRSRISSFFRKL